MTHTRRKPWELPQPWYSITSMIAGLSFAAVLIALIELTTALIKLITG